MGALHADRQHEGNKAMHSTNLAVCTNAVHLCHLDKHVPDDQTHVHASSGCWDALALAPLSIWAAWATEHCCDRRCRRCLRCTDALVCREDPWLACREYPWRRLCSTVQGKPDCDGAHKAECWSSGICNSQDVCGCNLLLSRLMACQSMASETLESTARTSACKQGGCSPERLTR